jgi:glycosyltransferase involved in cell wall biosynthesis
MKIAVLGTRGIPASYSGFETCVQETALRFQTAGHSVRVYCRKGRIGSNRSDLEGIELVMIPYIVGKHIETPSHAMVSLIHTLLHPVDVAHVYGAGNGWCVPFLRLFGVHVVFLVDGLDWGRAKWGRFAKAALRWGARIGSLFANHTVADSHHVISVMSKALPGCRLQYVPYGARIIEGAGKGKLRDLKLEEREYFLFVGRFVPEKNVHLLAQAFEKVRTRKKLVLVGGNSYDSKYEAALRCTALQSIVFPGFVFGQDYEELLCGCYAYIQPSALEGTSPSLLAAMGSGACVLASDIPENRETAGEAGFYFESGNVSDLARMIDYLDQSPQQVETKRGQSLERAKACYSWEVVSKDLIALSS